MDDRKKHFLDSPFIMMQVSIAYLTEIGGNIYVDVGGDVPNIKSKLTPPSSATHVLFGAGLRGEATLESAVVATKEEIFDQTNYGWNGQNVKAKKVRNFYTYYRGDSSDFESIGFSGDENIRFDDFECYDGEKKRWERAQRREYQFKLPSGNHWAQDGLDDHRLCIFTNSRM